MNMFKKNGGFTLVELIVVIAILAILAAVAVPAYTGYIAKAEEAADLQMLSSIKTAVMGVAAQEGKTVSSIEVYNEPTADAAVITVTALDAAGEAIDLAGMDAYTGDVNAMFDKDFKGADYAGDKWVTKKHAGAHADGTTVDHKCETNGCGLTVVADCMNSDASPKDHVCDVCGTTNIGEHKAAEGSTNCAHCGQPVA